MKNKINNRGFTLIELIATIAILAVVSTVSYVSITSVIKQSKIQNCEKMVNNIKTAAKEYVSDNRYKRTFVESVNEYSYTMDASTLVEGKYLSSKLTNPFDTSEEIDPSKIQIIISLYSDYSADDVTINDMSNILNNCSE